LAQFGEAASQLVDFRLSRFSDIPYVTARFRVVQSGLEFINIRRQLIACRPGPSGNPTPFEQARQCNH
jgi:hypothetical protein